MLHKKQKASPKPTKSLGQTPHTQAPTVHAKSYFHDKTLLFKGHASFLFGVVLTTKLAFFSWYKNEWTSRWRELLLNVKSQELSEVERICENVSVLRVLKNI